MQTRLIIEDPSPEDGFEGMFLGTPDMKDDYVPEPFDLHAAAKYVRENNLEGIDDEIIRMFSYEKVGQEK